MAWHPKIHTSLCLEALSHHQQLYVPSLRSVCPAGIGSEVWTPVVIGEFPEEDARAFLEVLLKERTALLNDSTWSKVYNVSHLCMPGVVVCAWIGGPHVRTIALFVVPPHVCSKTMCGVLDASVCVLGLPDMCSASSLFIALVSPIMPCRSAEAMRKPWGNWQGRS